MGQTAFISSLMTAPAVISFAVQFCHSECCAVLLMPLLLTATHFVITARPLQQNVELDQSNSLTQLNQGMFSPEPAHVSYFLFCHRDYEYFLASELYFNNN